MPDDLSFYIQTGVLLVSIVGVFFTLKAKVDSLGKDLETLSKYSLHRIHERIDELEKRDEKFSELLQSLDKQLIVLNLQLENLQKLEKKLQGR
jgi:hypothetical protein